MENETQDVALNNEPVAEVESNETTEETVEREEKPQETPEARKARLERQLKQINKKLGVDEDKPKAKPKAKSGDDIRDDYGKLSYLKASGIEADEELDLVESMMQETGKTLRELVNSKYFKGELAEHRESKIAKEAIPTSSKRASVSVRDSVDHWLKKPFADVPAHMKREVLNARIKEVKDTSMFSSNPIVSN